MRILLDGGQVYVFAAANCNPHYDKMLVETPTEIQEAPDGNGDTLIYADGTRSRTGGGVMPFTKTDAEYMTALQQADAAPANGRPTTKRRQPVTQRDAAKLCGVTEETIRRWGKGEATPEGYPGRGDALTLRFWAARREQTRDSKRAIKNTVPVDPRKLDESERCAGNWKKYGRGKPRKSDY